MNSKLKNLYAEIPPGKPATAADLSRAGVSADLAVHYVRSGWLLRLARGVYLRPERPPMLGLSLKTLETRILGLHVGGKSALAWHGLGQYVEQRDTLYLYGLADTRIPSWFSGVFSAEYHRKRLFREQPNPGVHVAPFESLEGAPSVSEPERALLELLSEVGVRQPIEEARELMEGSYTLRADVIQKLLQTCTSVKTVRLCLQLGQELGLPWRKKLQPGLLKTGSSSPWVKRMGSGFLVLKP